MVPPPGCVIYFCGGAFLAKGISPRGSERQERVSPNSNSEFQYLNYKLLVILITLDHGYFV
jgi:hypothetical protein